MEGAQEDGSLQVVQQRYDVLSEEEVDPQAHQLPPVVLDLSLQANAPNAHSVKLRGKRRKLLYGFLLFALIGITFAGGIAFHAYVLMPGSEVSFGTPKGYTVKSESAPIAPVRDGSLALLLVGDWGCNSWVQDVVADDMGAAAGILAPKAVISIGDNFYPKGVSSASDPQWHTTWREPFTRHGALAPLKWYAILGNHDYDKDPWIQINYHNVDSRWHMDGIQYSRVFEQDGQQVLVVFIETNTYEDNYWEKDEKATYFSSVGGNMDAQNAWLDAELAKYSYVQHKVVVGHHPIYSGGGYPENHNLVHHLDPILQKHQVSAYISGHDHSVQHIYRGGSVNYFVIGSGCIVNDDAPRWIDGTMYTAAVPGHLAMTVHNSHMGFQIISYGKAIHSVQW